MSILCNLRIKGIFQSVTPPTLKSKLKKNELMRSKVPEFPLELIKWPKSQEIPLDLVNKIKILKIL